MLKSGIAVLQANQLILLVDADGAHFHPSFNPARPVSRNI